MNNRIGFYISILTGTATVITFIVAYLTEPLSGPFCVGSCFKYPYLDMVLRFPADYIWMYCAIVWLLLYIIFMTCIHRQADSEKKTFSQVGLSFAIMSALILLANYFIQLSVVQPSLLNGEFDGIALITQYNPHGIFIALEELGFILMGVSFLFMAPVFSKSRLERVIRSIFIGSFVLTLITFILISIFYGINREYRFEVAVMSINWLTLIVSGILVGTMFKRSWNLTKVCSEASLLETSQKS
ncbi:MAG: hypothetical protein WC671_01830 [Candidatus Paceibacterota bacterium]